MENKRKFAIGDIHGEFDKLKECLELVNFDFENDILIQLGDVVDRGPKSYECVELLLKIKNLIAIRGNHDATWYESVLTGLRNSLYDQGGRETLLSYTRDTHCDGDPTKIPDSHQIFFRDQLPYYIDKDNNCFVHAGFNPNYSIESQIQSGDIYWDRDLWKLASYGESNIKTKDNFNKIFIGHTPTTYFGNSFPMQRANIWNLDTGCGKDGKLTIMNIDTEDFWQSK